MSWGNTFALPERMSIASLQTGESMTVFFNPAELKKGFSVKWNRLEVPGLPHEPLQYKGTSNLKIPLTLVAHAFDGRPNARVELEDFERFLMSLGYPADGASSVATGAPPTCLVIWPRVLSMRAKLVDDVSMSHVQFAPEGGALRLAASVTFEEHRTNRLTSEDVRLYGTRRPTGDGSDST